MLYGSCSLPAALVWQQRVGEMLDSLVDESVGFVGLRDERIVVGVNRAAQHGQADLLDLYVVAVLTVVQDAEAVGLSRLWANAREVDPTLPRPVDLAFDAPVGDLAGSPDQPQVYREPELERFDLLPPVDGNGDIYSVDGRVDGEVLHQTRLPVATLHPENRSYGPILDLPDPLDGESPDFVVETDHAVRPGIAPVFEDHGPCRGTSQYLYLLLFIVEARDIARLGIQAQPETFVLGRRFVRPKRGIFLRRRLRRDPVAQCRQVCDEGEAIPSAGGGLGPHGLQRDRMVLVVEQDFFSGKTTVLQLHAGQARPGVRVEDHDGRRAVLLDAHGPRDGLERVVEVACGDRHRLPVAIPRVFVGGFEAGAGEDVVELVEEHGFPGPREILRILLALNLLGDGAEFLRGDHGVFGPAVEALDARVRRVAADGMMLQFVVDGREWQPARRGLLEEPIGGVEDQRGKFGVGAEPKDTLYVLLGRASAVVAHSIEAHSVDEGLSYLPGAPAHVLLEVFARGAVLEGDTEGKYPRADVRLPPEQVVGKTLLVGSGTHEHIVVEPALREDLGQHAIVSEGVHVVAHTRRGSELLFEVALAVEGLPDEGLSPWYVAVWLYPPPAHDLPASLRYTCSYLLEHPRVALLDPLVEGSRARGEDEIFAFVQAIQGRAEGGFRLLETLLPLPEPHRVEVRVPDHMQLLFLHRSTWPPDPL